jgi:hypothetical protein
MQIVYHCQGNLGQWNTQSTAKALQGMKENKTPLATASGKVGGPGNTLRSRLIIDNDNGRRIRKCGTLNGTAEDRLVRYLLSD